MAQNYRVGADFNLDYSTQEPQHQQSPYDTRHQQQLQHAGGPGLEGLHTPSHPQHQQAHLGYGGAPMQPHLGYGTSSMQPQMGHDHKRSRPHDDLDLELGGLPSNLHDSGLSAMSAQPLSSHFAAGPSQRYHGHHLPESSRPSKVARLGGPGEASESSMGAPSVVGQPGMPSPAPKPRGPKLKFTPEDDALLVDLKENKSLTWKQIAEFFPGRSSGTLQVRYCTKLKAKTTLWTDETVSLALLCSLCLLPVPFPLPSPFPFVPSLSPSLRCQPRPFLSPLLFIPALKYENVNSKTANLPPDPKTTHSTLRLRDGEMASRSQQSRNGLYAGRVSRESEGIRGIIAFVVPGIGRAQPRRWNGRR
jgi:hypothetical protein